MYRTAKADSLALLAEKRRHILLKYSRHSYLKPANRTHAFCDFHTIIADWLRELQAVQLTIKEGDEYPKEEEITVIPPSIDSG